MCPSENDFAFDVSLYDITGGRISRKTPQSVNLETGRLFRSLKLSLYFSLDSEFLAQKIFFDTGSAFFLEPLCVFLNNG